MSPLGAARAGVMGAQVDVIPDSVVSRPGDDSSTDGNDEAGLQIETEKSFNAMGAEISSNTTGFSTAYLADGDLNIIDTTDISSLSAGDAFSFESVSLPAGNYVIYVDCDDAGYYDGSDYPYTGEEIDITGMYSDGNFGTGQPRGVNNIGNPQGVLD